VVEGVYEFLVEGRTIRANAGCLLYVLRGALHAHKNVGARGAGRMLATPTPGGLDERFFEEVGNPVDGETGPLDFESKLGMRRILGVATEHGIEIPVVIAS
jgi:hypothetical protein